MKTTIRKWFWAWNFDKEEQWLNDMAAKGLALIDVGFCRYTFENTSPGEYAFRLELLNNLPEHKASQDYISFVKETGAEYVGAVFCWAYFRKKTDTGAFDLYSDNRSRIQHLNRILLLLAILILLEFFLSALRIYEYFRLRLTADIVIASLLMGFALLIGYGFCRIFLKKRKLQKDQLLFE